MAALVACAPDEVIFTSGATEAASLRLSRRRGCRMNKDKRPPCAAVFHGPAVCAMNAHLF